MAIPALLRFDEHAAGDHRLLVERGAHAQFVDIDAKGAEAVAGQCKGIAHHADLINDDAAKIVADCTAKLGGLDGLVNNAGYGAGEAFLEMKPSTWDRTFDLNVRALAFLTSAAGKIMAAQKKGRIVNITSPASRMALPNYTAYAASKAAVDSVTRAAAVALAPHGVRVNSIAPGMMDTPMQRDTEIAFAKLDEAAANGTAWPWLVVSRAPFWTICWKTGLSKPAAPLCAHFRLGDFSIVTMKVRASGTKKTSPLIQAASASI